MILCFSVSIRKYLAKTTSAYIKFIPPNCIVHLFLQIHIILVLIGFCSQRLT